MTRRLASGAHRARWVAAAFVCFFCAPAGAQSFGQAVDQARVGLDRTTRLPLEIIWLQSEIQADMWRAPALANALQGCTRTGAPREGCAVSVRSAWRYSFDAGAGAQPAPIVISSLAVAGAPFAKGRLNLSGSGRVFLVTSDTGDAAVKAPAGVILLAAGSTVQLVDAAYPSIQIEVSAPQDRPLFLGNLAAAEVGRIFALLMPRTVQSASAADVLPLGRIALRTREARDDMQVALAAPATQAEPAPRMPVALAEPLDRVTATTAPQDLPILVLDTMPVAAAEPIRSAAAPVEETSALLVLDGMPAAIREAASEPAPIVADAKDILILDSMPAALVAKAAEKRAEPRKEILIASTPAPGAIPALSSELSKLRAEVEAEIARDNARMAEALQGHGSRHFRFGS